MPSPQALKSLSKFVILAALTLGPSLYLSSWADAMTRSLTTARR